MGHVVQSALAGIFLAIGNAYYEANTRLANPGTSSTTGTTQGGNQPLSTSTTSLSVEGDAKIKSNHAAFLDGLDQLDIMILQATEVLERRARQRSRVPIGGMSIEEGSAGGDGPLGADPFSLGPRSGTDGPVAATTETGATRLLAGEAGPSPETMLLNGEGLVPRGGDAVDLSIVVDPELPHDESLLGTGLMGGDNGSGMGEMSGTSGLGVDSGADPLSAMAAAEAEAGPVTLDTEISTVPSAENGAVTDVGQGITGDTTTTTTTTTLEPTVPVLPTPLTTGEEDMMSLDGPIDFGDMVFENINFDDTTHFDFGSMMDD